MVALVVPVELFTLKRLQVNSHCEAVSYCQEKSTAYLLWVKIFQMWPPGPHPLTVFYMLTAQRSLAPPVCHKPLASPMNSPQSSTALSQSYNNVPLHHPPRQSHTPVSHRVSLPPLSPPSPNHQVSFPHTLAQPSSISLRIYPQTIPWKLTSQSQTRVSVQTLLVKVNRWP